jgi:hypothetical protein
MCSSHPPLGLPNWFVNTDASISFMASLLGIEEEEAPMPTTRLQNSNHQFHFKTNLSISRVSILLIFKTQF